jgi:hypothetical protein
VLDVPGYNRSAVIVAALKMHILVSTLVFGKCVTSQRISNPRVTEMIPGRAKEYTLIADAVGRRQLDRLQQLMRSHRNLFREDNLEGLVHQVAEGWLRIAIQNLTRVFATATIAQMAQEFSCPEVLVKETLLSMIDRDEVSAKIHPDGTVAFSDREDNSAAQLEQLIQRTVRLRHAVCSYKDRVDVDEAVVKQEIRNSPDFHRLMKEMERATLAGVSAMETMKGFLGQGAA